MDVGTSSDRRFHGYRFPAVIIGEVVWLRFRFNLSLRDIPDLMAARGIVLSHQTVKGVEEQRNEDWRHPDRTLAISLAAPHH